MAEGQHSHDGANPLGLHTHPRLGINEASGEHDHALDDLGFHIHRAKDGRILVAYGGSHIHSLEDGQTGSFHDHHVLGAVGRDGNPLEIQVGKFESLMVVKGTTHYMISGDENNAVELAKKYGDFTDERGLVVTYRHSNGATGARFYTASDFAELVACKARVLEDAKVIAKTLGAATVGEVIGRCDDALIVRCSQSFMVENPVDLEKREMAKEEDLPPPTRQASRIHSIYLEKKLFPDPPAMTKWLEDNGFRNDRPVETANAITFLQDDSLNEKPEFEQRDIARGVVASFEKTEMFQFNVEFRKESMDEEHHTVEGLVYEPSTEDANDMDSQGDWATAEDIEDAAHYFLEQGLTMNVDREHDFEKTGSVVVESWIAKAGDLHYKVGSWIVKVKIYSQQLWEMVKSGAINGFSMAGNGVRIFDEHPVPTSPMLGGFAFSKAIDEVTKRKRRTRLTKIRPSWISLVRAGANLTDFAFKKSKEEGLMIWKSRDLQILDGDLSFKNERTLIDTIAGLFKKYLGGSSPTMCLSPDAPASSPATGGKVDMKKKIDPNAAGLFSLIANMAGRLAHSEKMLTTLFKHEGFEPFVKANPQLAESLQKLNPNELTEFAKLAEFLQQGSEQNGVTLPSPPANFFGFAAGTFNPMQYVSAGDSGGMVFPLGVMETASPSSGNDQGIGKKLDELEKAFADFQEKVKGQPTFDPGQLQSITEQLGGFTKSLDEIKDKVETLAKAEPAAPPTPPPTPVAKTGGEDTPAAEPEKDENEDPIRKAKDFDNPFGTDPVAMFGGIQNSGKKEWLG